jgi:hypothetical protein
MTIQKGGIIQDGVNKSTIIQLVTKISNLTHIKQN